MAEAPSGIDIKDPMIQAHFNDFSGEHDKAHRDLAQARLEKHSELFQSLRIHTPRVADPHDGSTRIVIWTWDPLSPKDQERLHEEVRYPMEFQTVGRYSNSS